jgi:hypothetical protein
VTEEWRKGIGENFFHIAEGSFFKKSDFLRVPDTFQLGAILAFCAFLVSRKIDKLRVFNAPEGCEGGLL